MVQRSARQRPARQPAVRDPLAGDRCHHPHRHLLGRPRHPRRPPRRCGRRYRPVPLDTRLRDSRLPDRPVPGADLRDQPGLVQGDRIHPADDVRHGLAEHRDSPDHRAGDRRYRDHLAAGSRLGARRSVARLRPHAPCSGTELQPRRLQARAPQRRRSRARPPRAAVHRHDRRCGDRGADLRAPGHRIAHSDRRPPRATSPS